ncbi:MAG: uncharacterized protein KVP18_004258 [Porospora cf. gigantea A]|uniref:uncharacterized protein n=1 Tax=Porospora cf. gigantea A TaxID=2853593 RepID=UPI00355A81B3|nr:MAG: hypothetical protein KVP18_004258 [Porospora cf. gigantea A]
MSHLTSLRGLKMGETTGETSNPTLRALRPVNDQGNSSKHLAAQRNLPFGSPPLLAAVQVRPG